MWEYNTKARIKAYKGSPRWNLSIIKSNFYDRSLLSFILQSLATIVNLTEAGRLRIGSESYKWFVEKIIYWWNHLMAEERIYLGTINTYSRFVLRAHSGQ